MTIRLFEQRVAREFRTGEIPGFVHMYVGEEAVAAGVCANLDDRDYVTSTHRGHGHCIAKGCDLAPHDGRDLRPRGRPLQGPRRLDAHRRLLTRHARRQRDRRRRHRARDRRGARRERSRERARSPSRSSATAPPTRACSTRASTWPRSGACPSSTSARTTASPSRRLRRTRRACPTSRSRAAAYGIPGVIADGADAVRRLRGRARGGAAGPRRGGPDPARGQDVPLHGPLRGRPRPLPRRRRPRGGEEPRRARSAARAAARRRVPDRGGARRARARRSRPRSARRSSSRRRARSPTRPRSSATSIPSRWPSR